jgi:hypothetical protein
MPRDVLRARDSGGYGDVWVGCAYNLDRPQF